MFYTILLKTLLNQNLDNLLIRKNWLLNLLTWAIGIFFGRKLLKILTDTCIDNHTDSRMFFFVLYCSCFFMFALLLVSDAYYVISRNEYVCM